MLQEEHEAYIRRRAERVLREEESSRARNAFLDELGLLFKKHGVGSLSTDGGYWGRGFLVRGEDIQNVLQDSKQ